MWLVRASVSLGSEGRVPLCACGGHTLSYFAGAMPLPHSHYDDNGVSLGNTKFPVKHFLLSELPWSWC